MQRNIEEELRQKFPVRTVLELQVKDQGDGLRGGFVGDTEADNDLYSTERYAFSVKEQCKTGPNYILVTGHTRDTIECISIQDGTRGKKKRGAKGQLDKRIADFENQQRAELDKFRAELSKARTDEQLSALRQNVRDYIESGHIRADEILSMVDGKNQRLANSPRILQPHEGTLRDLLVRYKLMDQEGYKVPERRLRLESLLQATDARIIVCVNRNIQYQEHSKPDWEYIQQIKQRYGNRVFVLNLESDDHLEWVYLVKPCEGRKLIPCFGWKHSPETRLNHKNIMKLLEQGNWQEAGYQIAKNEYSAPTLNDLVFMGSKVIRGQIKYPNARTDFDCQEFPGVETVVPISNVDVRYAHLRRNFEATEIIFPVTNDVLLLARQTPYPELKSILGEEFRYYEDNQKTFDTIEEELSSSGFEVIPIPDIIIAKGQDGIFRPKSRAPDFVPDTVLRFTSLVERLGREKIRLFLTQIPDEKDPMLRDLNQAVLEMYQTRLTKALPGFSIEILPVPAFNILWNTYVSDIEQ